MTVERNLHSFPTVQLGEYVVIEAGASIGQNVTIGDFTVIRANAIIHDGVHIGSHCILGVTPSGNRMMRQNNQCLNPLVVQSDARIGNHVTLYAGTTVGSASFFGDYANVREGVTIGENTVVGRMATIELNSSIGSRCTIQTLAYITGDTVIEDDVFIGPCVSMSNDKYMGLTNHPMRGPMIRQGARIGNNATLLPGVEIGAGAIVGAGSVVTRDVSSQQTVVGVPARSIQHTDVRGREP